MWCRYDVPVERVELVMWYFLDFLDFLKQELARRQSLVFTYDQDCWLGDGEIRVGRNA